MKRRRAAELLDEDAGTPAEVRQSLRELAWFNHRLGGRGAWRQLLKRTAELGVEAPSSWLDVGAGDGSLLAWLVGAANARGNGRLRLAVALDRQPTHLGLGAATGGGPLRLGGDALHLPFADNSFDWVSCNLFLHHFSAEEVRQVLQEMLRVARVAVLASDLRRAWIPWLVTRGLGPWLSRLTRFDAPASVQQAYTLEEMRGLASTLCADAEVRRARRYRWQLIVRKSLAASSPVLAARSTP